MLESFWIDMIIWGPIGLIVAGILLLATAAWSLFANEHRLLAHVSFVLMIGVLVGLGQLHSNAHHRLEQLATAALAHEDGVGLLRCGAEVCTRKAVVVLADDNRIAVTLAGSDVPFLSGDQVTIGRLATPFQRYSVPALCRQGQCAVIKTERKGRPDICRISNTHACTDRARLRTQRGPDGKFEIRSADAPAGAGRFFGAPSRKEEGNS